MSEALEATKLERDLTLTDFKAAHDGQRKAKETYEAKGEALVKKLKGNSACHIAIDRVDLC